MRKLICILAGAIALAACSSEDKMGAYLFTYFNDPTHSLFMAISYDGYEFTALNGSRPVIEGSGISEQHGIRDPHIQRGPDGCFYIVMTDLHVFGQRAGYRETQWERDNYYGWGNNRGLIFMKSDDLIHWSHHVVRIDKLFPERFGEIGCAWAPESIWDPEEGKMMVYFTIRERPEGEHSDGSRTKLFYSYADEDFTTLLTEPQLLFEYPDPNVQVLDADICPMPDGRWFMTYVAQENPGGIKYMISDKINHFEAYNEVQIDSEASGCEAPNTWKRIGEDKWVTMYDIYSIHPNNFGFVETSDFKTWTPLGHFNEGVMKASNFVSPKHGSVIPITLKEARRLEEYWSKGTDVQAFWLPDRIPSNNPVSLFGDVPQEVIESLGLQEGIPASMSSILVKTGGEDYLFDAGLGSPDSKLMRALRMHGVDASKLKHIYITHLHGDHIGGLMNPDNFPEAELWISREEYEGWKNMESGNAQQLKLFEMYEGRIHLFEFGDVLDGGIKALDARGHTPGHTVYQAGDYLIVGDLMHGAALQMEHPEFCARYDQNPEASVANRIKYLDYAKENDLKIAGMHLPGIMYR